MIAFIDIKGKQFKVKPNSIIEVEKIKKSIGDEFIINKVLAVYDKNNIKLGKPYVTECKIKSSVFSLEKNNKISIIKFKRRKQHIKHLGHRQWKTKIKIIAIQYNFHH